MGRDAAWELDKLQVWGLVMLLGVSHEPEVRATFKDRRDSLAFLAFQESPWIQAVGPRPSVPEVAISAAPPLRPPPPLTVPPPPFQLQDVRPEPGRHAEARLPAG